MAIKLYAVTGGNKDEKCGRPAAKNNPRAPTRSRNITRALYSVSGVNLAAIFLLIQQVASWDPFFCDDVTAERWIPTDFPPFWILYHDLIEMNIKNLGFPRPCAGLSSRLLNRAGNVKKGNRFFCLLRRGALSSSSSLVALDIHITVLEEARIWFRCRSSDVMRRENAFSR